MASDKACDGPKYTVLCPSDITINTSQQPCVTDPINYGTLLHDPNNLSHQIQQQLSQIFDHPYNAKIRGRKDDIVPLKKQRLIINHHQQEVKRGASFQFCLAMIILLISIVILIVIQPLDGTIYGVPIYIIMTIIAIIGLISSLLGLRIIRKSCTLDVRYLWNQSREIRLFRFDVENNNIHYMVWSYDYGIYPNDIHEPVITNTENIIICKIDQLIRISKQTGYSSAMNNWIEIHFKDDCDKLQSYRYVFKTLPYWNKTENRASYGSKVPNAMDTYTEFKGCLDKIKPGWHNPVTYLSTIS